MPALSLLFAIALALVAAISSALVNLFVRLGTADGGSYDAIFTVLVINSLVLLPPIAVLYYPEYGVTWLSVVSFVAAGLVGTALGQLCSYRSISIIGASRTTPIVASWALFASVFGVLFLGETITPIQGLGILFVVGGVVALTLQTSAEANASIWDVDHVFSLLLPLLAAFLFGIEPILATYGFAEGTPAPVGLVIKTVAATVGFSAYLRWRRTIPGLTDLRSATGRWYVLAGLSSTIFLVGYYVSLEIAPVNVVTPLIITNTMFVVLFSALFIPQQFERVTWKITGAATAVVTGVVLISLYN